MIYIERNGLRILQADFGYLLHHKENDTLTPKLYLGVNDSLDNYEEVDDPNVDYNLKMKMKEVASLNKIGKLVANQVTDDIIALDIQEFYDVWTIGIQYKVGQYLRYNDILYKVLQEHISQETWKPNESTSLYTKVLIDPTGETILEWEQPESTNGYMKGDKVNHKDKNWESEVDNNVWEPGIYGWVEIE